MNTSPGAYGAQIDGQAEEVASSDTVTTPPPKWKGVVNCDRWAIQFDH